MRTPFDSNAQSATRKWTRKKLMKIYWSTWLRVIVFRWKCMHELARAVGALANGRAAMNSQYLSLRAGRCNAQRKMELSSTDRCNACSGCSFYRLSLRLSPLIPLSIHKSHAKHTIYPKMHKSQDVCTQKRRLQFVNGIYIILTARSKGTEQFSAAFEYGDAEAGDRVHCILMVRFLCSLHFRLDATKSRYTQKNTPKR